MVLQNTVLHTIYVFMWQSVKVSNIFNNLTLKQIFWKTKTFFEKLEYCFLVETTKIENTLPFKTALSNTKANVKTNCMVNAKRTYHKDWSFASNYFLFFGKFVPVLEPLKPLDVPYQLPKYVHIRVFCQHWSLILRCFFPVSILNPI